MARHQRYHFVPIDDIAKFCQQRTDYWNGKDATIATHADWIVPCGTCDMAESVES